MKTAPAAGPAEPGEPGIPVNASGTSVHEHGFSIPATGVNTMVTPGWVSQITHTFKERGTFLLLRNEYCGSGHQLMATKVEVK